MNQDVWLSKCLKRNAETEYGKRYGFQNIHTAKEYQKMVPLITYEDINSFITRIAKGENDILFAGEPIAFEVTGGSLSGGKLIPYTQEGLEDFQRAILPWIAQTKEHYQMNFTASYWSISPILRDVKNTPRGIAIGVSDMAYLGEEAGSALASGMLIPSWVAELKNLSDWQLATLYWLVCSDTLEFLSVWSPTFLLMLMQAMQEHQEPLQKILHDGGVICGHIVQKDREALRRFNTYIKKRETAQLWPNLKLISCWSDAMSKPFSKQLLKLFPHAKIQPKGLLSTECVVTMPDPQGDPLLSYQSGFYEFMDMRGAVHFSNSLIYGEVYEVIVTTNSGLYRYRSGDLLRYEGQKNELPILRFIGRKGVVSDMVGEKLNEIFIQQALKDIEEFCMIIPQSQAPTRYLLLGENNSIESFVDEIEKRLIKNPQYAYARKIGQLEKLEAVVVTDAMKHFFHYKTMLGSRVGDIKIPALHIDHVWLNIVLKERK